MKLDLGARMKLVVVGWVTNPTDQKDNRETVELTEKDLFQAAERKLKDTKYHTDVRISPTGITVVND